MKLLVSLVAAVATGWVVIDSRRRLSSAQTIQLVGQSYAATIKAMMPQTPRESFIASIGHLTPEDRSFLLASYDLAQEK